MDLIKAINQRRSCRAFLEKPVEKDTLENLKKAAEQASGKANARNADLVRPGCKIPPAGIFC